MKIDTGNVELEGVAVFSDGSGTALENIEWAEKHLTRSEEVIATLKRFIEKHLETLKGVSWSVGYGDAEILLRHGSYLGKPASPKDIARLFPNACWKREQKSYDRENIHYVAEVDGVTLRIECAEKVPNPTAKTGRVEL